MAEIKQVDGRPVIDYMARDYDSLLRSMRALIPEKLPDWTDYESESDFGNALLQLFAHMGDIVSYYQDRIANESFLGTAQTRRSILHHLRLIGYRLATAAPASTRLDVSFPRDCSDKVTIRKGDAFATTSHPEKPSVRFEYTADAPLEIDCSTLDGGDDGRKHYTNGIPAEEGQLIKDEILDTSNASPNQRFPLAHRELILRAIGKGGELRRDIVVITELNADETETKQAWRLQESLAFSQSENDFTVEIDEGDRATVLFGDGVNGAIPPKDVLIKATYRVGGGAFGNVPAGSITTIVNCPQLVLAGAEVTNLEPAVGGADRESIEHAVRNAPAVFRSLRRAVTAEDYETLALQFKGVGKVRAKAANWNTVKLYVAPEGGGYVSDLLAANLLAYFEDRRPITTIIEIQDVDYVSIYVTAEIGVEPYYSVDDIREKVKRAAGEILAFENASFGQTIYLSKFYEAIEAIAGVRYVNVSESRREDAGEPLPPDGIIELSKNELARIPPDPDYSGGIRVIIPAEGR